MSAEDDEKNFEVYYMAIALLAERRSKDPARQVGACIVNQKEGNNDKGLEGRVIGIGYNGMPLMMPWDKIPEQKNFYVVHAEANAIVNMNPQSVANCAIYVTLHPCIECARKLILSGISKVVFLSFDKCYSKKDAFKHSEKLLKGDKEIEYVHFREQTKEKMILEINFRFPDKKSPRQDGSHSSWWPNEEQDSENEPGAKKPRLENNYKAGDKYVRKEIDLIEKDIKLLKKGKSPEYMKSSITQGECEEFLKKREDNWDCIKKKLKRISLEQYFMGLAIIAGDLTGSKAHEGACIVNEDGRIIGLGYCGIIAQIEVEEEEDEKEEQAEKEQQSEEEEKTEKDEGEEKTQKGEKEEKAKEKFGAHAPVTAIVNRNPVSLRGCTLYVTQYPCHECAKDIVQAGIKTVIYLDGGNDDNKNTEVDNAAEGVGAEDKNQEGDNAEDECLESCSKQLAKGKAKNVSPVGCAEHHKVNVKDNNISPDPAEIMFELAEVKCVSYREDYELDSILLDFSKSDL